MTPDLPTAPEGQTDLGPVNNMRRAIRDDEQGEEVGIKSFLNFDAIQPGKTIRVYRLANRDVAKGQPAIFEMHIEAVDKEHKILTFSGSYKSANTDTQFIKRPCVIHPNGAIAVFPSDIDLLPVVKAGEMCLIFEDTTEELPFDDEGDDTVQEVSEEILKQVKGPTEN